MADEISARGAEGRRAVIRDLERLIAALDAHSADMPGIGAINNWLVSARMRRAATDANLAILFADEPTERLARSHAELRSLPAEIRNALLDVFEHARWMGLTPDEHGVVTSRNDFDPARSRGFRRVTVALMHADFDEKRNEITPEQLMAFMISLGSIAPEDAVEEAAFAIDLARERIDENFAFVDEIVFAQLTIARSTDGETSDAWLTQSVHTFLQATGMQPPRDGEPLWSLPSNAVVTPFMEKNASRLLQDLYRRVAKAPDGASRDAMMEMLNNIRIAASVASPELAAIDTEEEAFSNTQRAASQVIALGGTIARLNPPADVQIRVEASLRKLATLIGRHESDAIVAAGHAPEDVLDNVWRRCASEGAWPDFTPDGGAWTAGIAIGDLTKNRAVIMADAEMLEAYEDVVASLMLTQWNATIAQEVIRVFREDRDFEGIATTIRQLSESATLSPQTVMLGERDTKVVLREVDRGALAVDRLGAIVLPIAGYTPLTKDTQQDLVPIADPSVVARGLGLLLARLTQEPNEAGLQVIESVASRMPREGNEEILAMGVLAALQQGHTDKARELAGDDAVRSLIQRERARVAPPWRADVDPAFARAVVATRVTSVDVWDLAYDTPARGGGRLIDEALNLVGPGDASREPVLPNDGVQQVSYRTAQRNVEVIVNAARTLNGVADLEQFPPLTASDQPQYSSPDPRFRLVNTLGNADSPTVFLLSRLGEDEQRQIADACRQPGIADDVHAYRAYCEKIRGQERQVWGDHITGGEDDEMVPLRVAAESVPAFHAAGQLVDRLIDTGRLRLEGDEGPQPALRDREPNRSGPGARTSASRPHARRVRPPRAVRREETRQPRPRPAPERDGESGKDDSNRTEQRGTRSRRSGRYSPFGPQGRVSASRRIQHPDREPRKTTEHPGRLDRRPPEPPGGTIERGGGLGDR